MALNIVVCVKQVIDPETPSSAFKIDADAKKVVPPAGIPPVVNGFDEHAVEAALRIKDAGEANVTIISAGHNFVLDVMKKPLSMGADGMIMVDDAAAAELDAFATVRVLSEAIKKAGDVDLVLCGRQASDWDNAHVPMGVAEALGLPCITLAQKIDLQNGTVNVHRSLADGYEVVEAATPALVTVSNELGEARYPTLRGIMAASRKSPEVWSIEDLGLSPEDLAPRVVLQDLFQPVSDAQVEIVSGEDEADAGRKLADRLRELKLI